MRRPTSRLKTLAIVASSLVTFSLGVTAAVFVATEASAASPTTSTKATSTKATSTTPETPAARFFVINGTVNAASVHVIGGSSAFPNFATGAVDNYYSLAHSHVDNSPSAEGRASPFDTGPIGQTAAAGHFQQPQYAEARWPGDSDSGKATYGKQGEPYAAAEASEYKATAEASEASRGLSGPSGSSSIPVPKGFDDRLGRALAEWKATWLDRLDPKKPADTVTTPKALPVPTPKATPVPTPKVPSVPTPKAPTVPTPIAPTVTTPTALKTTPPVQPPSPPVPTPSLPSGGTTTPSRSLTAASSSADAASLLESSTLATLDPKTERLVTSGESSLGRVSLGGGQIVIKGIHVSASIANDGSPTYKVAVSVAAASIGGVPVTIDEDGVHIAGQGQGLPYQQASDALNGALRQAGIQISLVAPEVTTSSCAEPGAGTGTDNGTTTSTSTSTTTTTTTTTTTPSDQTGTTTPSDQSGPMSSCDQPTGTTATCEPTSTGTGTGTTTTTTTTTSTTPTPPPLPTPIPTPPGDQPGTTTTASSCGDMGTTKSTTSTCLPAGTTTGTTTTSNSSTGTTTSPNSSTGTTTTTSPIYPAGTPTTTTTSSSDQMGADTGTTSPGQQATGQLTVRATGLRVVFTQPVNQSGVPAQNVEHILGEVFVDSLAVPAGPLPDLGFSSSSASSSSASSCPGGGDSAGTGASGGASLAGGGSSGSLSPSAATFGSGSQPISGSSSSSSSSSNGTSLPAAFAAALKKPLWLLLAYVLWQALVIGTGVSLWNWRRGAAS